MTPRGGGAAGTWPSRVLRTESEFPHKEWQNQDLKGPAQLAATGRLKRKEKKNSKSPTRGQLGLAGHLLNGSRRIRVTAWPQGGSSNNLSQHREGANLCERQNQGIRLVIFRKMSFFLVHSEQEPCEISSTQGGGGGGGIGGGCSSLPEFSELQSEIA